MNKNLENIAKQVKEILDTSSNKVVEIENLSLDDAKVLEKEYFSGYKVLGITSINSKNLLDNNDLKYTLHVSYGGKNNA